MPVLFKIENTQGPFYTPCETKLIGVWVENKPEENKDFPFFFRKGENSNFWYDNKGDIYISSTEDTERNWLLCG
jgi:hypothetical protein